MTRPYRRLTWAEKRRYSDTRLPEYLRQSKPSARECWRCRKCDVAVMPDDRAGHLARCAPEVVAKAFKRVS